MIDKPKILTIGYSQSGFGFGRVLGSLLPYFTEDFETHHFELGQHDNVALGWKVYTNDKFVDMHGLEKLTFLLKDIRPDIVFLFLDLWYVPLYLGQIVHHSQAKTIAYCPVDGKLRSEPYLLGLCTLDYLVTYTEFARSNIQECIKNIENSLNKPVDLPQMKTIAHGVDLEEFYPISGQRELVSSRHKARQELFPNEAEIEDLFIILNANRNQPRKNIQQTIESFAIFAKDKPSNVKLYLHMGLIDEGINVKRVAEEYDVLDRLLMTTEEEKPPRVSNEHLNLIFNACDVGLNSSVGEGWGLVAFEHGATGAAQIMPAHGVCQEVWGDNAILVPTVRSVDTRHLTYQFASTHEISNALERCYQDRQFLNSMRQKAFSFATQPKFSWHHIAAQFIELFYQMIS